MYQTLLVFLALASFAPAADLSGSQNPCQAERSERDCAVATNNLGSTYFSAGKYREAEPLFTRAISLWATDAAPSNDLAKAFHNLGAVYRAEGRNVDAVRFYLRALTMRESITGPGDVSLLPVLNGLGLVYLDMADFVEADNTLQRAMAIVQAHQAETTENAADTFTAFGVLLETEGKNADAIVWLGKALDIRQTLGDTNSFAAADAANGLALAYRQEGDLPRAESLYRRALVAYRQAAQPRNLVAVLNNLGRVLTEQSQYKEAEQFYHEAIDVAEQRLGPEHPDVAIGVSGLGKLMLARRKFSDAEPLLQRAEQMDRKNFAPDHPRIGFDLCNEGIAAVGRKHYADAEGLFKKSQEILNKTLPANHPEIGKLAAHLANVYRLRGRLDESEQLYRQALNILAVAWGPENPQLLATLQSYEALLRARQEYAEAESVEVRTTKIRVVQALRNSN
jgi:tetratricopeptide (TPR) repeat protein